MIKREYTDELPAEVEEETNSVVWSRSRIFRCPRCKIEQEIIFTAHNDPKTDYDATCFREESYLNDTLGQQCRQCVDKMYNEMVEVEKTRPLTEMEQYYKRSFAPEEQEKRWIVKARKQDYR